MNKLSLLKTDQMYGFKKLNIINQRGKCAAITDFAILLGGYVSPFTIDKSILINKRIGYYWTQTKLIDDKEIYVVDDGGLRAQNASNRTNGGRIVLTFTKDLPITINKEECTSPDGILEIEYGYYPRTVAPLITQRILEEKYISNQLKQTGNIYTTDSRKYNENNKEFLAHSYIEYETLGKRYVRIRANTFDKKVTLSNGEKYKRGDYVWVEVEPVKWLVDEKEKIMITEEIIFAGIQFNSENSYSKDFDSTNIKRFIDTYLSKQLFQVQNKKGNETNLQETQFQNEEDQLSSLIEKLYKSGYSAEQIIFFTTDILKNLSNNSKNTKPDIHQKIKRP